MRLVVYVSANAVKALEDKARSMSSVAGVKLTSADAAKSILYGALGLGPDGEERVITKLGPPTPATNEVMNPSTWVPPEYKG